MAEPLAGRVRSVREIRVIEVEYCKGSGERDDAYRLAKQYWTFDGQLLAEDDPADCLANKEPQDS